MKIIHTADLHLDANMTSNLSKEKAKERKDELIETYKRLVSYARDNDIQAILISGDMFDKRVVGRTLQKIVEKTITDNPAITFFYLRGNHDDDSFLANLPNVPDNLKLFSNTWSSYKLSEEVVITGMELDSNNSDSMYGMLVLDSTKINIVMLHGQDSNYISKDKAEVISINGLKNKAIDYLALGHIHGYRKEQLDARGEYCYPGCLEGRGFDECGEHGFVLLNVDEERKSITSEFVPFAKRRLYELPVDVTGATSSIEMEERIDAAIAASEISSESMVKIVLTGSIDINTEVNSEYLSNHYKDDYYFAKVKDETSIKIDYDSFEGDVSLKGEFVRIVKQASELSDDEKALIIRTGIDMLAGREV